MSARIPPAEYHALAASKGLTWLGPVVSTKNSLTTWECSEGHRFRTSYSSIRKNGGCRHCLGFAPPSATDFHTFASSVGLQWLGPLVTSRKRKTGWRCLTCEAEFTTAWHNITTPPVGCPVCQVRARGMARRNTETDYSNAAKQAGFEWLGPLPASTKDKTSWRCAEGHEFQTVYNNVHQGQGCPVCDFRVNGMKVSKPQLALYDMLGGELNLRVGRYAVDIALEINGVRIGVEFDNWYWHQGNEAHDAKRDADLIKLGWRMLHIKANIALPDKRQLDVAIHRLLNGETRVEIVMPDFPQEDTVDSVTSP